MSKIEELADRVERLLVRYGELQRTNALLAQQLAAATDERDNLRARLNAARYRVDSLLERLPSNEASADALDAALAPGWQDGGAQHQGHPGEPAKPTQPTHAPLGSDSARSSTT